MDSLRSELPSRYEDDSQSATGIWKLLILKKTNSSMQWTSIKQMFFTKENVTWKLQNLKMGLIFEHFSEENYKLSSLMKLNNIILPKEN